MHDAGKFRILTIASAALIVLAMTWSVLQEYVISDVEGYLQRKNYYERVIRNKGLSEHKGMYWKEKSEGSR